MAYAQYDTGKNENVTSKRETAGMICGVRLHIFHLKQEALRATADTNSIQCGVDLAPCVDLRTSFEIAADFFYVMAQLSHYAMKHHHPVRKCPLQVYQLSRSSESTHFLFLCRDVALFDSTRVPNSF